MTYQPRSLLVTGGAGFIGINFLQFLLKKNYIEKIINLDKLTYAGSLVSLAHLPVTNRYHFIQGDITDSALIQHILQHYDIDTIVHFAAESHVDRSIANPSIFVNSNILGTHVLLESARHYWLEMKKLNSEQCRFHHISTDEVYGSLQSDEPAFTEACPYRPHSPYSASKASADHLVDAYYHTYGLPITISHCSNNYGPYQHREKFIPTIIHAALQGTSIPIYGNGKNIRDWLYVLDHCRGIFTILEGGQVGEHYNIGGNNEWENITLAKYICQLLDQIKPNKQSYLQLIKFIHDRPGHDFRYAINHSKITQQLGWQPTDNFANGLANTVHFYLRMMKEDVYV